MSKGNKTNICGGELRPVIDPKDDDLMVRCGLRAPKIEIIQFHKTPEERAVLKEAMLKEGNGHIRKRVEKSNDIEGKATIYIENFTHSNTFPTTITKIGTESEIKRFINNLVVIVKNGEKVDKLSVPKDKVKKVFFNKKRLIL